MAARAPLTRDLIVDTARAMISSEGLDALSLRHLASRLEVTAPALYAHVDAKADLLRLIAERQFRELIDRFEAVEATDPLERIRAHARAYVEHALADPELFKVLFLFPPAMVAADQGTELSAATEAFAMAAQSVLDAQASGAVDVDDPLVAALSMWCGAHGVATVLLLGVDVDAATRESLLDHVIGGIVDGFSASA
jgi:AcrR family transcriptional regulator